jgi:hypothetical protein
MAATKTPAAVTGNNTRNGTETAAAAPGTATGTDTRPAPNQIAGAVWFALMDNPGATAAALADKAGVAKATARRALKELETAGYAARTTGGRDGGKRTADTWNATPAADTSPTGASDAEPATADHKPTGQSSAEAGDLAVPESGSGTGPGDADTKPGGDTDGTAADTDASGEADGATGDGDEDPEAMDETAVTEASEALTELATVITSAVAALETGDRVAALTAAESIYGDSAKVRRLIKTAANHRPRSASGTARSHPGELRAKVAAHLAANPGLQLTPHEVAKAIGHSAGAVANALDKLTETGEAVMTCDRPRRFTATAAAAQADAEARAATA